MSACPMLFLVGACSFALMAGGCGRDSLHRLAYGAVQSAGQQRCLDYSPSGQSMSCLSSQSYDEYQRQRRELAAAH
jgi:hypothetical protein